MTNASREIILKTDSVEDERHRGVGGSCRNGQSISVEGNVESQ